MYLRLARGFRNWALAAWIILVIATTIGFVKIESLTAQNRQRVDDIQQSRLDSCKTTYESFHAVFDPFFPPPGKRTAKQMHDLAKFNRIIATKIQSCIRQVTPPPIKGGN